MNTWKKIVATLSDKSFRSKLYWALGVVVFFVWYLYHYPSQRVLYHNAFLNMGFVVPLLSFWAGAFATGYFLNYLPRTKRVVYITLGVVSIFAMYFDATAGIFAYLLSTIVLWLSGLYILVSTAENKFVSWRVAWDSVYPLFRLNKKAKK